MPFFFFFLKSRQGTQLKPIQTKPNSPLWGCWEPACISEYEDWMFLSSCASWQLSEWNCIWCQVTSLYSYICRAGFGAGVEGRRRELGGGNPLWFFKWKQLRKSSKLPFLPVIYFQISSVLSDTIPNINPWDSMLLIYAYSEEYHPLLTQVLNPR